MVLNMEPAVGIEPTTDGLPRSFSYFLALFNVLFRFKEREQNKSSLLVVILIEKTLPA